MTITCHSYRGEEDYWRMREFLRQVFVLNQRLERCWHIARLDYARWHVCLSSDKVRLEDVAYLWETDGHLVAFMMPDGGPGEVHFCVHPDYDSATLAEEMLQMAEAHLSVVKKIAGAGCTFGLRNLTKCVGLSLPGTATRKTIGLSINGTVTWIPLSQRYRSLRATPSVLWATGLNSWKDATPQGWVFTMETSRSL